MNWSQEELSQKLAENKDLRVEGQVVRPAYYSALRSGAKTEPKVNKYHVAKPEDRTYNGRTYASKKEMLKAQELDLRVKAADIDFYLEQVPFKLPGNRVYRLDFVSFKEYESGSWEIEYIEVKGKDLPMGKLKRAQTEELYGISIQLV